jgi:hypothetical protein
MKNVKIKENALIGYGIAVEGDKFDAFGNPCPGSTPMLFECNLTAGLHKTYQLAKEMANMKSEHGVAKFGRVVVVELRALEEVTPTPLGDNGIDF